MYTFCLFTACSEPCNATDALSCIVTVMLIIVLLLQCLFDAIVIVMLNIVLMPGIVFGALLCNALKVFLRQYCKMP